MAFTEVEVAVKQVSKSTWELLEPVEYRAWRQKLIVPAGFRSDFASVPTFLTWLVPRYGIYTKSAILHDYLYRNPGIDRAKADDIFRHTMHELGVPFFRRWLMWAAVRIFGSQLSGAKPLDVLRIFVFCLISVILLVGPVVVIAVTLVLFWLVELSILAILFISKQITGKRKHLERPEILGPLKGH